MCDGVILIEFRRVLKYSLHLPGMFSSLLSKATFWSLMDQAILDFLPRRRRILCQNHFLGLPVVVLPRFHFGLLHREIWLCFATMTCLLLIAFFTSWIHEVELSWYYLAIISIPARKNIIAITQGHWRNQGLVFLPLFGTPSGFVPHTRAADEATAALNICLSSHHLWQQRIIPNVS